MAGSFNRNHRTEFAGRTQPKGVYHKPPCRLGAGNCENRPCTLGAQQVGRAQHLAQHEHRTEANGSYRRPPCRLGAENRKYRPRSLGAQGRRRRSACNRESESQRATVKGTYSSRFPTAPPRAQDGSQRKLSQTPVQIES